MEVGSRFVSFGLEALGGVDLSEEFHKRPHTMRSIPGAYRGAMQFALDANIEGRHRRNVVQRNAGGSCSSYSNQREEVLSPRQVGRQVESVCIRR